LIRLHWDETGAPDFVPAIGIYEKGVDPNLSAGQDYLEGGWAASELGELWDRTERSGVAFTTR